MNLAQIGNLGPRGQALLSIIIAQYQIFRVAEFRLDASTHLHSVDKQTATGSAARAEGGAVQKDQQTPVTEAKSLQIYTGEVSIDKVRAQDKVLGLGSDYQKLFADRRMDGNVLRIAEEVQNHMFLGTYTDNQMLGILELIKDADAAGQTARLGFTAAELAAMRAQVSLQLNSTANQDAFIEKLEEELANVPGANAIIVNGKLGARLTTIGKRLHSYGQTMDQFGFPVETYNNVPIIRVPTTAISQTMNDGVNADNTALVIARFAESQGCCYSTNSGFLYQDFGEVEGSSNVAQANLFLSTTVEKQNAVKVLYRIRL